MKGTFCSFIIILDIHDFHILGEINEAFEKFRIFKARVGNECRRKIKYLRSEKGGEFTFCRFERYYEKM